MVYVRDQLPVHALKFHLDDHYFDALMSRTCHGHPLPCNSTGSCVSQEDASRVASLGNFEYK
jgi:hypothetical protein